MKLSGFRRLGPLLSGHLVLAGLLTLFAVWYLTDAWMAEASVYNLVLIAPAGLCAIAIGLTLMLREIRSASRPDDPPPGTFAMMGLLGAFVALLPLIGFTAAIFLFLLASARLLGVRRPVPLLLYTGLFTLVLMLALTQAVRLPEPLAAGLWRSLF